MTTLLLILAALAVYDVLSTVYVLHHGGRERNKFLNWLFMLAPNWVEEILLFTKVGAAGAIALAVVDNAMPVWVLGLLVGLYVGIAVNNTKAAMKIQ